MQYAEKITLCEVGPRDGLQNEAKLLTAEEKTELIEQMIGAGFKVIEVGSFVSPKAVPQMANTDDVFLTLGQREGVQLRALIANERGDVYKRQGCTWSALRRRRPPPSPES